MPNFMLRLGANCNRSEKKMISSYIILREDRTDLYWEMKNILRSLFTPAIGRKTSVNNYKPLISTFFQWKVYYQRSLKKKLWEPLNLLDPFLATFCSKISAIYCFENSWCVLNLFITEWVKTAFAMPISCSG